MRNARTHHGCGDGAKAMRRSQGCASHAKRGNLLRNYRDVVQDYIDCCLACANDELAHFQKLSSLEQTISKATRAEGENGKLAHQRRIPPRVLGKAASALQEIREEIRKCGTFEQLQGLIERRIGGIKGIGKLMIYDTALRIGAKQRHYPQYVHLHAGTRGGAKALGLDSSKEYLHVREVPKEFRRLKPHQIEDCLCIYKDELMKIR